MPHPFHFFRSGGVDQVSLRDGADMLALAELDQKLWVALAMPSKGIDIDPATLALIDHDADGRVRVQDILAAVSWAKTALKEPEDLLSSKGSLQLSAIADARIVTAAKRMLSDLGKKDATSISVDDTIAIDKAFAETVLNGDGVVIPASATNPDVAKVIEDAVGAVGPVVDRSGKPGVDTAKAAELFTEVDKRAAWLAMGKDAALQPLGAETAAAAVAFGAVRAKIDDYFTRCKIAAYDTRAAAALGGQEPDLLALAGRSLTTEDDDLAALPLAKIEASGRLAFGAAINPAWSGRMEAFRTATVAPIIGTRDAIKEADVKIIAAKLAPHLAWLDEKPATKVEAIDPVWLEKLAGPELRRELATLIALDLALADEYTQISAVSKIVRMQRDFGRILRNFVNFSDFYSRQDGVFQAGTLYIDARALHLCVPVTDAAKHGALAGASEACLLYCDITRAGETRQIAAAMTNGDMDNVFVGRNGIFYDREHRDWDATVTKIITSPISVRAAFFAPYRKLVKAIEDTIAKRTQAAEAKSSTAMEAAGTDVAHVDKKGEAQAIAVAAAEKPAAPEPEGPKKIDLGTIAAIGVAIGGIGTLFGALLATLFGLGMWLPFGVIALILMISGPSMLLAWLKLRRRNLGPILDANGWAINGRARINVSFGAAMTELAKLPPGSKRSLDDPFADKKTRWKLWLFAITVLVLAGTWYVGRLDRYLPDSIKSVEVLGSYAPGYKAK